MEMVTVKIDVALIVEVGGSTSQGQHSQRTLPYPVLPHRADDGIDDWVRCGRISATNQMKKKVESRIPAPPSLTPISLKHLSFSLH